MSADNARANASVFILPPGAEAGALAPLPLAALRINGDLLSGLARVGLRLVGQVAARPRGPLARRFGRLLLMRLDQALGAVEEAISPRLPVPELMAERRLAEPISRLEDVEGLVLRLGGHLRQDLIRRGLGARRLDLALFRVDGHVLRASVGTSRPLREPAIMLRLFAERLAALGDDYDAGFGFDMIRLCAGATERFDETPQDCLGEREDISVGDLVDRLGARLGRDAVLVSLATDTHLPERAERQVPATESTATGRHDPGWDSFDTPPGMVPWRPLRLFDRPEPVETLAAIPDGPPLRFRWRRVLYQVLAAEGPERIADNWWAGAAPGDGERAVRDYFRVEAAPGRRFWLFREGLYGDGAATPRWFIHGLFA